MAKIQLHVTTAGTTRLEAGLNSWPPRFYLSVVLPVYNERNTVVEVIRRVRESTLPLELIVVDDGSTDGTRELLSQLATTENFKLLLQPENRGKGAALRAGFAVATGAAVVVQDADLEYDPGDLVGLLPPILENQADVVYGSRFTQAARPGASRWHWWANRWITRLTNLRTGYSLTDVETCYKVIRRDLLQVVTPELRENRFGIEIELTIKLAKHHARITERPVSYAPRSYAEGKKIGWRDAVRALYCLLAY